MLIGVFWTRLSTPADKTETENVGNPPLHRGGEAGPPLLLHEDGGFQSRVPATVGRAAPRSDNVRAGGCRPTVRDEGGVPSHRDLLAHRETHPVLDVARGRSLRLDYAPESQPSSFSIRGRSSRRFTGLAPLDFYVSARTGTARRASIFRSKSTRLCGLKATGSWWRRGMSFLTSSAWSKPTNISRSSTRTMRSRPSLELETRAPSDFSSGHRPAPCR